ncbi:hypothetical protein E1B28_006551 [Marasmius oreades]|uniref:Uncharacterized protein n=1 Tax=Marasmius oreades TaxID=181124 RepID=A0A9P7S5K1_9AGAR|nr:uncharacterized protein E1B28_006551 [Marasmius oreades]KAG7095859.1 hypothetical protein E1B28_006551 [Marasmius oreades]
MSLARAVLSCTQAVAHRYAMTPPNKTQPKDRYHTEEPWVLQIAPYVFYVRIRPSFPPNYPLTPSCVVVPFCPRRFLCHRRDPSIPDFRIPHFFHPPLRPLLIDVRINNTSLPNRHSIPPSWYMDSPRLFRDVGKTLHLRFDAPGESQIGHNAVLRLRPPPCLYWFSSPRSGNHLLPSD